MGLYQKHRPTAIAELAGQTNVKKTLPALLDNGIRTFLLQGSTGTGKTTTARIIKEHYGVHDLDFQEINIGNKNGVADSRAIADDMSTLPMYGDKKMYLLDEAQMFTKQAWNNLLKPLEDCPDHVIIVLATSEPNKIIEAVKKGRCQTLIFNRLLDKELGPLLQSICKKEDKAVEKTVLKAILSKADGSARNAITLLESIINLDSEDEMIEIINVVDSLTADETVSESCKKLCRALATSESWDKVKELLKNINEDPEKVRYHVLGYLSYVMMNGCDMDYIVDVVAMFEETFDFSGRAGLISACYSCCP